MKHVTYLTMLTEEDDIPRLLNQAPGHRAQVLRKPRDTERLLDVLGACHDRKELTVHIQRARERLGEPVQRHRFQDGVEGRVLIRPVQELLADPREERERAGRQGEADRARPRALCQDVRHARLAELVAPRQSLLLQRVGDGGRVEVAGRGDDDQVEVDALAGRVVCGEEAADEAAEVAALRDVAGAESETCHEVVHDPGDSLAGEIDRWRWTRRQCEAWQ